MFYLIHGIIYHLEKQLSVKTKHYTEEERTGTENSADSKKFKQKNRGRVQKQCCQQKRSAEEERTGTKNSADSKNVMQKKRMGTKN